MTFKIQMLLTALEPMQKHTKEPGISKFEPFGCGKVKINYDWNQYKLVNEGCKGKCGTTPFLTSQL